MQRGNFKVSRYIKSTFVESKFNIAHVNLDRPSKMSLNSGSVGLRKVLVPYALLTKFESLAEPNTNINIETCGFLTGTISSDQLKITHLIIPKQSGTSDSCITRNEEEMHSHI